MSSGVPAVYRGEYDNRRRFGGRARLEPKEPQNLKDGDVIVSVEPYDAGVRVRYWPDETIHTTYLGKELRVPLEYAGVITDFTAWSKPIVDLIASVTRPPQARPFSHIIFEVAPTSPLIERYLGFKAPESWWKILIKYNFRQGQEIGGVYAHFSRNKFHGARALRSQVERLQSNLLPLNRAGGRILEHFREANAKMSRANQSIGVFCTNIDVYEGLFWRMAPGWTKVDYRMFPECYFIVSGPSNTLQRQIDLIQRDAEQLGFAYKMQVSSPGVALVRHYPEGARATAEFRVAKSSRYLLLQVVMHQTLVDLTLTLADQFGLMPDTIFQIADWLPAIAHWSQFVRMQSIWATYKTVQRIRAARDAQGAAASSSAPSAVVAQRSLSDLRQTDVAPEGATIVYGRSIANEPFVIPQNRDVYDSVRARLQAGDRKHVRRVFVSPATKRLTTSRARVNTAVKRARTAPAKRSRPAQPADNDEDSESTSSEETPSSSSASSSSDDEDDITDA
jgi:hypothetical protein